MLEIDFYTTASGADPVKDYISEQSEDARVRLWTDIRAFAVEFPSVETVSIKHLDGKVWEIRVRDGAGIQYRVLYAVLPGTLAILVAFTKKTQKTPPAQIKLAQKRLKEMTS